MTRHLRDVRDRIAVRYLDRTARAANDGRLHPLLAAPCTCGSAGGAVCIACARWSRHYRDVTRRVAAARRAAA